MQTPDSQTSGTSLPCLFTPAEVAAGDAVRQPTLSEILRAAACAPDDAPERPVGGPKFAVLLGDPVRLATLFERERMKARPLDVAATAASLSAGLVRVLILGLEDRGKGVPMWVLTGISDHDIAWCRRRAEGLRPWGLGSYVVPDDARDARGAVFRITVRGRQVARHIVATARIAYNG